MKSKAGILSLDTNHVKSDTGKRRTVMKGTIISTELVGMDGRYLQFFQTPFFLSY